MHQIYQRVYQYEVDKQQVKDYWDEVAYHDHWQESGSGLSSEITWKDERLKNKKEAEKWIEDHDSGWYDQLAVSFYSKDVLKYTTEYKKLYKKVSEQKAKVKALKSEIKASKVKAKFLSCPSCESKLSTKILSSKKTNDCPLCGASLLSQTQKDHIKKEETKLHNLEKQLREAEKDSQTRNKRGKGLQWLVKVEWHC